ncbi:MAG: hypothetical protein ACKVOM_03110 [Ferruginibacter sp.]
MKKKLLVIVLAFFVVKGFAQLPEDLMEEVSKNHTVEKIYLHYDKQYYKAGETIWFKAYVMQGFLPGTISTTLNVSLLNDSGKLIDNKILPIAGGALSNGNFNLSPTLPAGSYTVVANTVHMKNYGPENFYTHSINVHNSKSLKSTDVVKDDALIDFLPEGGNFVAGILNNVAFKCADRWGYPLEMTGTVTDAQGKSIATFKTTHDGMGVFEILPVAGEKYIANCILTNGIQKNISLPFVQSEGIKLNVKRKDGKLYFEVDKSTVTNEKYIPEYLLGVEENSIALKAPLTSSASVVKGAVPLENLETGILQLTVFNKMHQPLAERLVFINKQDFQIAAEFESVIKNLSARQKNEFSFVLPDTLQGSYSVAVTDGEIYKENNSGENILSRFLINNQLKGYIHNAAYYLEQNDEVHTGNLDLVMLTNGWRRYSWSEILNNKLPKVSYIESNFISLNGTVKNKTTGVMMGNTEVTAIIKTKKGDAKFMDFVSIKSLDDGSFTIPSLIFEDTAKFSFVNSFPNGVPLKVELKPTYLQGKIFENNYQLKPSKFNNIPAVLGSSNLPEFENGITLNTVFLKTFTKKVALKTEERYASGSIGGMANTTLDFIKYPPRSGGLNILEYLKSRLPGVNISGRPGTYAIQLRTVISLSGAVPDVSVFIDGVPANPDQASNYSINDIALVQLYSSNVRAGAGGALVFYTKQQADREDKTALGKDEMMPVAGYSPVKQFYAPNYLLEEDASIIKDERTTLYWNPNLTSDGKSKKVSFSFFNSDKAKKYNIVVEGMTKDGKFLHLTKEIE